jgi:hypothetical protein
MWHLILIAAVLALTLGAIRYVSDLSRENSRQYPEPPLRLLPGDISYESPSGNFRFYFPIATSIVLAIVLSIVLRIFG